MSPSRTMPSPSILTVIVVSCNMADLLSRCLASIPERLHEKRIETIVVDNASSDGSADVVSRRFAKVNLIRNVSNLGFAAANNQGLRRASGPYTFLFKSAPR